MKLELKKKLIADVEAKFGPGSGIVIEYLYEAGTLDDCLARRHMARVEEFTRLLISNDDITQIHFNIAQDYSTTDRTVRRWIGQ
jgi:hypothetical protein